MLRFCSQEEPRGLLWPPSPQHIRLQLCGNMPGLGAAARTLLAPMEEASCCGPKSFLKVHTGSLACCQPYTLPLARFLALMGQSNTKALSPVPFPLHTGFSSPCSPSAPHSCKCSTAFQKQNHLKKETTPGPLISGESCLFSELLKPLFFAPSEITFFWEER